MYLGVDLNASSVACMFVVYTNSGWRFAIVDLHAFRHSVPVVSGSG